MKAKIKKNIIVKYKWLCGFACLVIGLIACHPRTERPTLERAEAWMDSHPDSAQQLLEAIPQPEKLSKEEYATWCLLVTQARDKNYVVHTSDSVIDVAVRYFGERNDSHRKAQAYYCQGRVLADLDISGEALTAYLNAEEAVKETSDRDLEARICNHLGMLYWWNQHTRESLHWYQKAYCAYEQINDTSGVVNVLLNIGSCMLDLGQPDSALFYANQAYCLAEEGQVDSQKIYILSSLANCYSEMGVYKEALQLNLQSLAYGETSLNRYYAIGELYEQLGQSDSAIYYAEKALLSNDLYVRCSSSRLLYKVYVQEQNYPEALRYNEQYVSLRDSIEDLYSTEALNQVKSRYEKERMVNRHQWQMEQAKLRTYGWALWGLVVTIVALLLYFYLRRRLDRQRLHNQVIRRLLEETNARLVVNRKKMEEGEVRLSQIQEQLSAFQQETDRLVQEKESYQEQLGKDLEHHAEEERLLSEQIKYLQEEKLQERKKREEYRLQNEALIRWKDALIRQDDYLYKKVIAPSFLQKWEASDRRRFFQRFDALFPEFRERISSLGDLDERQMLVVCLVSLGIKTSKLSSVLGLGTDMTTQIKSIVRERCFPKRKNESLDRILRNWY